LTGRLAIRYTYKVFFTYIPKLIREGARITYKVFFTHIPKLIREGARITNNPDNAFTDQSKNESGCAFRPSADC